MFPNTKSDLNSQKNTQEEVFHASFDAVALRQTLYTVFWWVGHSSFLHRTRLMIHPLRILTQVLLGLAISTAAVAQSLQVIPPRLDFGPHKKGALATAQLQVKNTQEDAIVVLVKTSGTAFSATPDTLRLETGTAQIISLQFQAEQIGDYDGALSLQVKSFFKADTKEVPLRARAVEPQLVFQPAAQIDLGTVAIGQVAEGSFILKNTGEVAIQIDSLRWAELHTGFQLKSAPPHLLEPGKQALITLAFAPKSGGEHSNHLFVVSPDLPQMGLDVNSRVLAPRAAVSPLPAVGIDYETVELGQSSVRKVTLLNLGQADLYIESMEMTGSGFLLPSTVLPATLAPDQRLELAVPFQPKIEGLQQGLLHVQTNDPTATDIRIPLSGRGQISPPRIEILNGTSIHFGSVPIGKTSRDHLLLWNRGGSPYTVQLDLREDVGIEFNLGNSATLLQPGESSKISLDFSPKEIGMRQAALDISTESGPHVLRLQGVGQFLKLSPATVDFGQVAVGENSSQIIEIANIGNADLTINQIRSTSEDFTVYTQIDPSNRLLLPANSLRTLPVHIAFSPSSRGTVSGNLRLDGFWEEGTETLDVLLNGTGVAAEIEIHPTGVVDFGYVVLGETEERTLVATNSGDTILQVEAHPETPEVRVDPAHFSLDPGQSTRLKIYFSPGALGERLGRVLLVSNDVKDKARPLKFKGQGALKNIDLARIAKLFATRKEKDLNLPVGWNNTPVVQKDGTKIDVAFEIPDSLRQALIGRDFTVEWTKLDANYDPKGSSKQTVVKIYESSEGRVLAEDLNLRLTEKDNRRVRVKITTSSYPGAPPQSISQILQAGGWKWEFEAKPLISFLTIRPGRDYKDSAGNLVKGQTERLIGLPGLAFAGWHNVDNPSVSGIHFTAIGNVLEALSTENSLAVSMGLAVSFYKDQFLFGFGWDVYDTRQKAKRKGSQDYIMTFKYSGLFK